MVLDCVLRCSLKQWISRWPRQGLSWSPIEAVAPISNRPFRSLLEYLEEVLVEVLQIVVLCKGQVSRRRVGGRMISC